MSNYALQGLTCQNCVEKVTRAFEQAGYEPEVTLDPPGVEFPDNSAPPPEEAQKILKSAGSYTLASGSHSRKEVETIAVDDERLTPLFVIIAYIIGGVLLIATLSADFSFSAMMNAFMGGFFIVFSMFKMLNLPGFAEAYATYDIVAARSRAYAFAYPFIELILGIAYFFNVQPFWVNLFTFILMAVGTVGVFRALQTKRKFQCACLGTALKLPMTKVTLVEDVTMGIMALIMMLHTLGN